MTIILPFRQKMTSNISVMAMGVNERLNNNNNNSHKIFI